MSESTTIPEYVSGPVLRAVAEAFEVRVDDLLSPARSHKVSRARQAAYMLLRAEHTCTDVGILFSRDHTTVLYGAREAEQRAKDNPRYAMALADAMQRVREL